MHVGIITRRYPPLKTGNGAAISTALLAESLVERGFSVTVFSFDYQDHLKREEIRNNVRVIRKRSLSHRALPLSLMPTILRIVAKYDKYVDIFHIYHLSAMPGAGLYKISGGKKAVIATLNGYSFCPAGAPTVKCLRCYYLANRIYCMRLSMYPKRYPLLTEYYAAVYPMIAYLAKKLDCYIAPTEYVKKLHVKHGFPEDRIVVIPNFVNVKSWKQINVQSREREDVFNILYVGKLSYHKGTHILLRAFAQFSRSCDKAKLNLVGGGNLPLFIRLARKLKIEHKVKFHGHVSEKSELVKHYLNADVFVHPAIYPEPFNRTILEALQFEVPVIVSNVADLPKIVNGAGLSYKYDDPSDLADKLVELYNNVDLLKELKLRCRAVLNKYSIDNVIPRIIRLYATLLS